MNTTCRTERNARIIFCDDSDSIRRMMGRQLYRAFAALNMAEPEITILGSTQDEVRSVAERGPAFDMVVCDQNIGTRGLDGIDLLGSDIARILHTDNSWTGLFVLQTSSPHDVMEELSKEPAIDLLLDKVTGLKKNADAIAQCYYTGRTKRVSY